MRMDGWITTREAAKVIGKSRQMVDKHLRCGLLRGKKVGRDVFFWRPDVKQFKKDGLPVRGHARYRNGAFVGYVLTGEAAKMLNVTRRMVNAHIKCGNLAGVRLGRDTFIARVDVMAYKKSRRSPGWQHNGERRAS